MRPFTRINSAEENNELNKSDAEAKKALALWAKLKSNQGRPKIKIDALDLSLCFTKYQELVSEGRQKNLALEKIRRLLLNTSTFTDLNPNLEKFSTRTIRRWFDKMKKAGQKPFMAKPRH